MHNATALPGALRAETNDIFQKAVFKFQGIKGSRGLSSQLRTPHRSGSAAPQPGASPAALRPTGGAPPGPRGLPSSRQQNTHVGAPEAAPAALSSDTRRPGTAETPRALRRFPAPPAAGRAAIPSDPRLPPGCEQNEPSQSCCHPQSFQSRSPDPRGAQRSAPGHSAAAARRAMRAAEPPPLRTAPPRRELRGPEPPRSHVTAPRGGSGSAGGSGRPGAPHGASRGSESRRRRRRPPSPAREPPAAPSRERRTPHSAAPARPPRRKATGSERPQSLPGAAEASAPPAALPEPRSARAHLAPPRFSAPLRSALSGAAPHRAFPQLRSRRPPRPRTAHARTTPPGAPRAAALRLPAAPARADYRSRQPSRERPPLHRLPPVPSGSRVSVPPGRPRRSAPAPTARSPAARGYGLRLLRLPVRPGGEPRSRGGRLPPPVPAGARFPPPGRGHLVPLERGASPGPGAERGGGAVGREWRRRWRPAVVPPPSLRLPP